MQGQILVFHFVDKISQSLIVSTVSKLFERLNEGQLPKRALQTQLSPRLVSYNKSSTLY